MSRAVVLLAALLGAGGCDRGPKGAPAGSVPNAQPGGSLPDAPLDQFCGPHAGEPCSTLADYLASLRAKECATQSPPPKLRRCKDSTVVDVDYGIVGYSRYFDASGTLVGAIAHLYEYGRAQRYGAVAECTGAPVTLCDASAPPPR